MSSTGLPESYQVFLAAQESVKNGDPFNSLIEISDATAAMLFEICEHSGIWPKNPIHSIATMYPALEEHGIIPFIAARQVSLIYTVLRITSHSMSRMHSVSISEVSLLMRSLVAIFFWYFTACKYGPQIDYDTSTKLLENKFLKKRRTTVSRTVFLSYATEDALTVKAIYDTLKSRGHQPWMDKINLLPGQNWDQEVRKAIRSSDIVLACISDTSISKRGYVQKEMRLALDVLDEIPHGNIFLIPVRLEESCKIPEPFRHLYCINLYEAGAWLRLYEAIEKDYRP